MNADARQERAEDIHAAEEAVAAATEKASQADVTLRYAVDRLFQCPTFYPDGQWDNAFMRARDAWERSNLTEQALVDARLDRDRVSGEK